MTICKSSGDIPGFISAIDVATGVDVTPWTKTISLDCSSSGLGCRLVRVAFVGACDELVIGVVGKGFPANPDLVRRDRDAAP